jgi:hypothetical protein
LTYDKLRVFQVFHKRPETVIESTWIEPLSVGGLIDPNMRRTDVLNNINHLNDAYNELTAIYWVWKNLHYDYVGFFHYRRVLNFVFDGTWKDEFGFTVSGSNKVREYFSSDRQRQCLMDLLRVCPVIIPRLTASKLTTEGHYKKYHNDESWDCFLDVLAEKFPNSRGAEILFSKSNLQTSFNIFVMRREIFSNYCSDLFLVINAVYDRLGLINHAYNKRYPGFLAERFLHFWLLMHSVSYLEVPVIMFED